MNIWMLSNNLILRLDLSLKLRKWFYNWYLIVGNLKWWSHLVYVTHHSRLTRFPGFTWDIYCTNMCSRKIPCYYCYLIFFFFRLRKIDWGQICCIGGRIWGTLGVKLREWVASFIGFTFNLKHKPHFVCVVLGIIDYLRSLVWEVHPEEEIKLNEFVEVLLWRRVYTYQRMLEELS